MSKIRIGLLSTLNGPYRVLGEDGVRGAQLALQEHNHQAGGQQVEFQIVGTNALASSALDAINRLYDDGVRLFVGPLSGDEAIALCDFANQNPDAIIVCGAAASQPHFNPAENFFMFHATGAQSVMGLGKYAYHTRGFRQVATVGQGYSFPFAQVGGFALDFINQGGKISKYVWFGLGTEDYRPVIASIPPDVDAVFSTLGGRDGIHFVEQFREARGDLPLIAGSIFGDQSLLHAIPQHADLLTGVTSAGPIADNIDTDAWRGFVQRYRAAFPEEGFAWPSFFAHHYYVNTRAALLALDKTEGDLAALPATLAALAFDAPSGPVHLDHHRVAVCDVFINELRTDPDGKLYTHNLERIPQTTSTLGLSDEAFMTEARFGMHNMPGAQKRQETFEEMIQRLKSERSS